MLCQQQQPSAGVKRWKWSEARFDSSIAVCLCVCLSVCLCLSLYASVAVCGDGCDDTINTWHHAHRWLADAGGGGHSAKWPTHTRNWWYRSSPNREEVYGIQTQIRWRPVVVDCKRIRIYGESIFTRCFKYIACLFWTPKVELCVANHLMTVIFSTKPHGQPVMRICQNEILGGMYMLTVNILLLWMLYQL